MRKYLPIFLVLTVFCTAVYAAGKLLYADIIDTPTAGVLQLGGTNATEMRFKNPAASDDWISIDHSGTHGEIDTGSGGLNIRAGGAATRYINLSTGGLTIDDSQIDLLTTTGTDVAFVTAANDDILLGVGGFRNHRFSINHGLGHNASIYFDQAANNIGDMATNDTIIRNGLLGDGQLTDGITVWNNSTHQMPLAFARYVEHSTAGVGSPQTILGYQSGVYTNEGSAAENYLTLPTAVAGTFNTFVVQDADGIRVTAGASDTIRFGTTVSAGAGYCSSTEIGATVTLVAINATEWVAYSWTGSWGIDGTPLAGGASDLATVLSTGNTTGGTDITVSSGDSITAAAGTNLTLTGSTTNKVYLGSASAIGAGDGRLEISSSASQGTINCADPIAFTIAGQDKAQVNANGILLNRDQLSVVVGQGTDGGFMWNTQTGADHLLFQTNGGHYVFAEGTPTSGSNDYGHADTDPVVYIHSATASGTATDEWVSIKHDTTDAKIDVGTGAIRLGSDGTGVTIGSRGGGVADGDFIAGNSSNDYVQFDASFPMFKAYDNNVLEWRLWEGLDMANGYAIDWSQTNQADGTTAFRMFGDWGFGLIHMNTVGRVAAVSSAPKVEAYASALHNLNATTDVGRRHHTNEGAAAEVTYNLPTAAADYSCTFIVQDADGQKIVAASGDTIRIGTTVSAGAGYISSTEIGASVTLVAINATEWVATTWDGAWGIDGTPLATGSDLTTTLATGNTTSGQDIAVSDDDVITHGDGNDIFKQGETTTLTDGVATTVFSVVTGDGDMAGLTITYTVQSTDATEYQAENGTVHIAIVDDAGGVVASTPGETSVQALSSGTLSTTWSVVTTDDQSIEIQLNADTSLTASTHQVRWHVIATGDVTLTVP